MPDIITVVPQEMDPIIIEIYTGLQGGTGPQGVQGPAGPTTLIIADIVSDNVTGNDALVFNGLEVGDVIDGVTLTAGMLVLVPYRTNPASNAGLWRVQASGFPVREPTLPTFASHVGTMVNIKQGTKYANTVWRWTGAATGTLGTTAISYDRIAENVDFLMFRDVGIVEKTEILIPEFYYVNGREGMILVSPSVIAAPNATRYFTAPLSTSKSNMVRVWYDRAYHIANPSDPQGAIQSETNVSKIVTDRYQKPEICVSNFGNVNSKYNFIGDTAGVGENQFTDSLTPENWFLNASEVPVDFTDSAILAYGITKGVTGATSAVYQGMTFTTPLVGGEYYFARFYVESIIDNDFATTKRMVLSYQAKDNNEVNSAVVNLTLEKQLSARAAIFSIAGVLPSTVAGTTRVRLGLGIGVGATLGAYKVGGGQFCIARNAPVNWIMRQDFPNSFSGSPIMGKDLWLNDGRPMPIYFRNLLPKLTMEDLTYGTLSSVQSSNNNYPYIMANEDNFRIDPTMLGSTCELAILTYSDTTRPWRLNMDVHRVASSGLTGSPRVLMVGDEFMDASTYYAVVTKLQGMGLTPVPMGTIPSSQSFTAASTNGALGESRPSQGWGDLSGLVPDADTPAYFALGTEATYTADTKSVKYSKNPFLRLATGGDNPSYVTAGGYIFDFRHYLNRFSFADPDVVIFTLGYNDIMERTTVAQAVADINLIVPFILQNVRAACPGVKIGVGIHLPSLSETGYAQWPLLQAVNAALIAAVNAQPWGTFTVPMHAHMCVTGGWAPLVATPVQATGLTRVTQANAAGYNALATAAFRVPVVEQVSETVAAFVSNVTTWDPLTVVNRANVLAAGGTMSETEFQFRNNFFLTLRAQGLLPYIDEFWFGTTYDSVSQQVLVSALKGIVGVGVNAPTYGPLSTAFGSGPYIRTGYIPSVHGTIISGDNMGLLFYDRANVNDIGHSSFGAYVSDTQNMFMANRNNSARIIGGLGSAAAISLIVDSNLGMTGITRSTGASVREEWRRGVLFGTTALGTNGTVLPDIEIYLGGRNENGTRTGVRNVLMSMAMIVAPMSGPNHLALYNAVQAMMTARGGAV